MSAWFASVPVDRITVRARHARPGRTFLTVVAGLLFGLGWLLARSVAAVWLVIAWCGSAVVEGWISAREGQARGPGRPR
jgi:uncharacterized membrane protein YedE/YeeE